MENEEMLKALQEAHRIGNKEEILRLEGEIFEHAKVKIADVASTIDEANKKVVELNAQPSSRKINGERRRLYKEWIALYRNARAISDFCSKVKKDMRQSMGGSDDETSENAE